MNSQLFEIGQISLISYKMSKLKCFYVIYNYEKKIIIIKMNDVIIVVDYRIPVISIRSISIVIINNSMNFICQKLFIRLIK